MAGFEENLTYKLTEMTFAPFPDDSPPQPYEINFKFSVRFKISEGINILQVDDREYLVRFRGHQFSSFDETQKYMEEQLMALPVTFHDHRRELVDHALRTASNLVKFDQRRGGAPQVLNLHFGVFLEHKYNLAQVEEEVDYDDEDTNCFLMTPAADSSIEVLKAAEYSNRDMEMDCPICLENVFSGDCDKEASSMPCSHIFHGDCIKHWLMTSHYCPLCRFEMPTGELDT